MDEQTEQRSESKFEQKFRATRDYQSVAFGSADGTTHRLEADGDGVITAKTQEDAAHLETIGLRHVREPKPASSDTPATTATRAGKE